MPGTLVIGISTTIGGWLKFDGSKALLTGSFTTLESGPYQGQPGLWAHVVELIGIEPAGTLRARSPFSWGALASVWFSFWASGQAVFDATDGGRLAEPLVCTLWYYRRNCCHSLTSDQ